MTLALSSKTVSSLKKTRLTRCCVCAGDRLENVLELPRLPLTGIYVERLCPERYPFVDQALMFCRDCGHAQLLWAVDPAYLYVDTYSHRSSASAIAVRGNDFFAAFLREKTRGRIFKKIVEIGCNDLYLLKSLQDKGGELYGVDPIWKNSEIRGAKIRTIGKFLREVDLVEEIGAPPDLVMSAHTFEHMEDPRGQLERLMRRAAEGALFVLEIPAFDSLLRGCRFDQVFHQHIQYFSLASLKRLIAEVGGRYLDHRFNTEYWGGTLLVAFHKASSRAADSPDEPPGRALIEKRLALFRNAMDSVMQTIPLLGRPVYGYGAAQMLPVLAYQLKSDLGFLECILDDNPSRCGLYYPHLAVPIRSAEGIDLSEATVLVTALDSARPILKRLLTLKPRAILVPMVNL